jgi:membrane protein required for colicin V production
MKLNILDYIIIGVLVYLLIRGIMRGAVRETFSLVGVILGIWLGNMFQPWMTRMLSPYLPFPKLLPLLSFIFLFISIVIICNIIGWSIWLFVKKPAMGWFDRTLGAFFAILKGIVIIYLVIVMLTFYLSPSKTPLISGSKMAPIIISSYQKITAIIYPDHYKNWKNKIVGETKKIGDAASDKLKDMVKGDEQK